MDKKRIIGIAVIFIIIVLSLQWCNNNKQQQLKGEYKVLKEQLNSQKMLVKQLEVKRAREKDSLNSLIAEREKVNNNLLSENIDLRKRINKIKDKVFNVPKDLDGLVAYFNYRYKTDENKVVGDKVGLSKDVAMDVSIELEDGDVAIETVPLLENMISNQDTIILNLNKDKVSLRTQINSAENEISEKDKLNEIASKNIENLEGQVKKGKNKNFWNKVLIIAGTVAGYFIGHGISNK